MPNDKITAVGANIAEKSRHDLERSRYAAGAVQTSRVRSGHSAHDRGEAGSTTACCRPIRQCWTPTKR